MLKFKDTTDIIKNEFDLIEISSSKTTTKIKKLPSNTISNNIVNTFMTIFSDKEGLKSLKSFLITTSLWDLLLFPSDEEFQLIHPTIIYYYFSIPDRLSAAFKFETDEFFFPRNFIAFTEDSLTHAFSTSSTLNRFIVALERLDGFALHKLVKIPSFWDSLDFELISRLSSTSKQLFLHSLHKNILSLNFSFKKICKIIHKISLNFRLKVEDLVELFLEQFICKGSLDYKELALLISSYKDFKDSNYLFVNILIGVLKIWSNDSWIFRTPFNSQLHYTSCLMTISSLISPDLFSSNLKEFLMNGVQTRLDHSDSQVRFLGCCAAEILNQMHPESEIKLDFDLDSKNEIYSHIKECRRFTRDIINSPGCPQEFTFQKSAEIGDESEFFNSPPLDSDLLDSDHDDLKPISSLLKEGEPRNSKSPIPRFLSDCLKLLRSNDEAESVEKVLLKLEETFKTSSQLSRQIHAVSAFNTLLTLQDHFEIQNFDSLRHKTMETLLIDQIKIIGPDLIDSIFKSNKLVLGQKMELLSVICSSTQQIFRSNLTGKSEVKNSSKLNQFEKTFLLSETTDAENENKNSKYQKLVVDNFLDNLYLPLLSQSIRHFQQFKRNHVMFLDKFLWLQAIVLNFCQNHLQFDNLVERFLDFLHLTLHSSHSCTITGSSTNLIEQIPIQKALLIGTSVVLTAWPVKLPVVQYYQRLQEIYTFLDDVANGPGFNDDVQLQSLGTSVALALQDLTNPQKLIQESAEQVKLQSSFDIKSIKIISNSNLYK